MITGKTLKARGWPQGRAVGLAKQSAASLEAQGVEQEVILERLDAVLAAPAAFAADPVFGPVAEELVSRIKEEILIQEDKMLMDPVAFRVWGAEGIEPGALHQMQMAARLPVAVAGALMPDAHQGYGLPIGGVLATQGAVIPYAVGVDIACRMRLSFYDAGTKLLEVKAHRLVKALETETRFGQGAQFEPGDRSDHEVLEDAAWNSTPLLKGLRNKAFAQLGSSGTGNHFVEWGELDLTQPLPELGLEPGRYLALLSHSGSRGVGFKIATEYSRRANARHPMLNPAVRHLAWLDLDSDDGREYWEAMELAGRFAAANHAVIHARVAKFAGLKEVAAVENHHNFAWKEQLADGREVIVHRKGATPAGAGTLGIIPGSMADAGYLVRGRGVAESLNSASHGAGRRMSRTKAISEITRSQVNRYLEARDVTLVGGGPDEAPHAYKDIEEVIRAQKDLVAILGRFQPRIVRMADEPGEV